MTISLFDNPATRLNLLPLTYCRPVAALRCGILTIASKWERLTGITPVYNTEPYLAEMWPSPTEHDLSASSTLHISSDILPGTELAEAVLKLAPGEALYADDRLIARRGPRELSQIPYDRQLSVINHVYDLFAFNGSQIRADLALLPAPEPVSLPGHVTLIGPRENLYLHPSARVWPCIINVTEGPVYIGPEASVDEGAILRGPVAICRGSRVMAGARIYDAVTAGPHSKLGGEVANTVFLGFSNKAHDGYLGNAVIGEWCNIGAGTNASNLKNDYTEIKLWNYGARRFLRTGLRFCGLIMGDHSKAGIATMFNTATVIGVGCNIHGPGFPRNVVKSFSDGGAAGFSPLPLNAFFRTAEIVMARRGIDLSEPCRRLWTHIHSLAAEIEK